MRKLIPMAVAGAFIATAAFASIQQPAVSVNKDKAVVDTLIPQTNQDDSQFPTTDQNTTQFPAQQTDTTPVQTQPAQGEDTTEEQNDQQQNAWPTQQDSTQSSDSSSVK